MDQQKKCTNCSIDDGKFSSFYKKINGVLSNLTIPEYHIQPLYDLMFKAILGGDLQYIVDYFIYLNFLSDRISKKSIDATSTLG